MSDGRKDGDDVFEDTPLVMVETPEALADLVEHMARQAPPQGDPKI